MTIAANVTKTGREEIQYSEIESILQQKMRSEKEFCDSTSK